MTKCAGRDKLHIQKPQARKLYYSGEYLPQLKGTAPIATFSGCFHASLFVWSVVWLAYYAF